MVPDENTVEITILNFIGNVYNLIRNTLYFVYACIMGSMYPDAWCTCIWTHFFTCKSENLNLCFWICEIIAAPKRLHSSTQKQIVFICFISFVYTLNTKGTWMQTLWRRNQVIRYVFNFFPIRIRKIHILVLLQYASTPSTLLD